MDRISLFEYSFFVPRKPADLFAKFWSLAFRLFFHIFATVENIGEMPVLFVRHLVNFINFFLKIELIVFLSNVCVILFDGLLNVRLAFFHDFNILSFSFCQVVDRAQFFFHLFICPYPCGSQLT